MKKILLVVGSLRQDSFNRQLAAQIAEILEESAETRFLEFADLPYMNQDIEFPPPAAVERVRRAVQEADGIWVVSPEYNHQVPGVLKNLLDWLSRPLIPNDPQRVSAVKGKPVTISSVAGRSAGAGARKDLKTLLEVMSMEVTGDMGTGVALDGEAFQSGRLSLSDGSRKALKAQAEQFLSAV